MNAKQLYPLGKVLPHISHRRVAIADVECTARAHGSLRHGMTGGDNEVVATEIKRLDRPGKQREKVAVPFPAERQMLKKRSADRHSFNTRRNRSGIVKKGEQRCIGKEFTQDLKDLFPAAHTGEPVVNESHPFR